MSVHCFSHSQTSLALQQHAQTLHKQGVTLNQLFLAYPNRFDNFSLSANGIFLDYSKNLLTETIHASLIQFAHEQKVESQRDAMFSGEKVNFTEQRAALHTALRAPATPPLIIDGHNIRVAIHDTLLHMKRFAHLVREGIWKGTTGLPITDIVNIGIGGANLGPQMVCQALSDYAHQRLCTHFISNVDGHAVDTLLTKLNPATTLFIVSSKTFATTETLMNAHAAKAWLQQSIEGADVTRHFVVVSSNPHAAKSFDLPDTNQFLFWDWVGGRYSLWSAVGLPIVLTVGFDIFTELLEGAYLMDRHFKEAPIAQNIPIMLALIGIWNSSFLNHTSLSIAAYHTSLQGFPAFLQQLDMESNGKQINRLGQTISLPTSPIIWGSVGTNGQHAYFQHLHQSADITPVDFIAVLRAKHDLASHHQFLLANCFAQSQALMQGKTKIQVEEDMRRQGLDEDTIASLTPHRIFTGSRPSNTILLDEFTPKSLGALIALYEHKVATQGFCWGINSFDQWGVEFGKTLAKLIEAELRHEQYNPKHDSSTMGLIKKVLLAQQK